MEHPMRQVLMSSTCSEALCLEPVRLSPMRVAPGAGQAGAVDWMSVVAFEYTQGPVFDVPLPVALR